MARYPSEKSFMYSVIRALGRFMMAVFFRKIELRHGHNIPDEGPVVFVANHPNSIMDALVIGAAIRRQVNYIGHAGLFRHPVAQKFLTSCGVIPIVRKTDPTGNMTDNTQSFEACYRALEKGQTIGIFPEGTSDMLRQVKKVKTGAARIALETESRNGYQLGLKVIPIGLHFFSRSRFRSRVLVNVGEPIPMERFHQLHASDPTAAVRDLTAEIQSHMEKLTVNIQNLELDDLVRDVELIYREELLSDENLNSPGKRSVEEFIITQRIAECVEYYFQRQPERVVAMGERITAYKRKLARLHLRDTMLQEKLVFSKVLRHSAKKFVLALAGLPLALYGIVHNFIPHAVAIHFARKYLQERTKILTALLFAGGLAFLMMYAALVGSVFYFFDWYWAAVYGLSLPVSGLFALAYVQDLRDEQELISFSFVLFTNRRLIHRMRRERRILINELNAVKDEYLAAIASAPGGQVR